ncbi:MAG: radical SAM protein [Myxococcales bacterium]|nr:MAG: radical SAM protein [Myxococcales bacterium]
MKPMEREETGFFLPDDWILWRSEEGLRAIKLSSGDRIQIEAAPELDILNADASTSVWDSVARFEPLVGQLREELQERALQPLTRESILRGSGWRQLFVELTGKCNEQCLHCYAESSPLRMEALSWSEISSVLRDAKTLDFGLVQLTGGDPLISRHCVEAVELARKIGIPQVEIYTNGLALRGSAYERLRDLAPSFAFSFYSHDAQTHDAITRTPGSHTRTSRAIRRAIEDGLKVRVGVILMRQNRHDASGTREYLLGLGVDAGSIGFDQMRDVGRGDATPPEADARATMTGSVESMRPRNFGGSAAVSYDGTVYPCIFSRHLPIGSIREASLEQILTSAAPIAAREESLLMAGQRWSDKLSCWECQARSALLDGSCHA